jgi:hypothetical protein
MFEIFPARYIVSEQQVSGGSLWRGSRRNIRSRCKPEKKTVDEPATSGACVQARAFLPMAVHGLPSPDYDHGGFTCSRWVKFDCRWQSSLTPIELRADFPAWMPDGNEIIFSAKDSLWRLAVTGENTPTRILRGRRYFDARALALSLATRPAWSTCEVTLIRTSGALRLPVPARRPRLRR